MTTNEPYKVQLEVFEGPLDLLLYLIKQDEIDIYDIPIVRITNQYMQYLDVMKMLDLNIAGEFIVMAATLMMIKSRMLLPVEERPQVEDEEDPRWDLVRQLVEYKKFKDAAAHLGELEVRQENLFSRSGEGIQLGPEPDIALEDVSIFDLISAFNEALRKAPREELREIFAEQFTVAEKIDVIMDMMKRKGRASLSRLLGGMTHRYEMVCTFLAILELIRLRQVRAKQSEHFGDIDLVPIEDL
ncbi:MAG TPA: segregation/condensation protein A [Kiritimatiellia bacterium]|nr:segregation/condensation protein A [Kiritimatiellia bacterium]HMO98036.1 segregation/condensation protein A [Kiritimatiellia bacterium]HMP96561.1 segregation/condensation protein A [Kiritimatiellia bacterium]